MHGILDHLQSQGYQITVVVVSGHLYFKSRDYSNAYPSRSTRIVGRDVFRLAGRVWVKSELMQWLSRLPGRALDLFRQDAGRHVAPMEQFDEVIGEFPSASEAQYVARLVDRIKPDFVLFDTILLTDIISYMSCETKKIVITHDIVYRRCQSLASRGYRVGPMEFSREVEAALLARFDTIVAIQEDEALELRGLAPSKEVITTAMPVTFTASPPQERVAGRFIFVGSEGLTNADGLRWFIDRVWPATRRAVPHAELHVYGEVCRMLEGCDVAGVFLHGFRPDLSLAYRKSTIALAPLKAGSGLKIKLLEYLSFGLPCVATPVAVAGFQRSEEPPFLVAEDAAAFAHHTVRLCDDAALLAEMQRRTEVYVRAYSTSTVFRDLDRSLKRWRPRETTSGGRRLGTAARPG